MVELDPRSHAAEAWAWELSGPGMRPPVRGGGVPWWSRIHLDVPVGVGVSLPRCPVWWDCRGDAPLLGTGTIPKYPVSLGPQTSMTTVIWEAGPGHMGW